MKKAVEGLYNYLQKNPGPDPVTPENITVYFDRLRGFILDAEEGNRRGVYYVMTLSMYAAFAEAGFCAPDNTTADLKAFRRYAREYMEEMKGEPVEAPEVIDPEESEIQALSNHLTAVFPKKSSLPNNGFSHQLIKGLINDGETGVIFSLKGKPGEVSAALDVTRPASISGVEIDGNYNQYDAELSRGIDDIFMFGDPSHIFTLPQLYRVVVHNREAKPTDAELSRMEKSIDAQRVTMARGDVSKVKKDAEKRGIKIPINDNIDDTLLDLRGLYIESGGKRVRAYYIKERPLPSMFGALTGQEITIPAACYDIRKIDSRGEPGEVINKSPDRIAITGYIISRIEAIRNDIALATEKARKYEARRKKNKKLPEKTFSSFRTLKSNIILYNSIFEAAGIDPTKSRATIKRHKEYINDTLKYLQALGRIKGFRLICGKRKDSVDRAEIFID